MPRTVTVPGVGDVEFPDDMSDTDVSAAIQRDVLPHAKPATPQPRNPATPNSQLPTPPAPHIARIANIAEARLKAAGTTPKEVKRKAAAGEDVAPDAPTMYERTASDVAALTAGTGEMLGGIIANTPDILANIALAPYRVQQAGMDALRRGGSLKEAWEAARDVKPEYAITGVLDPKTAATDAEVAIRKTLAVRDKVVVPQADIMREVPNTIAAAEGIVAMTARIANIYRAKGLPPPETPAAETPVETPLTPVTPEQAALLEQAGRAQAEAATKPQTPRTALEQAYRDAMALQGDVGGDDMRAAVRETATGRVIEGADHQDLRTRLSVQGRAVRDDDGNVVWHDEWPGYEQGVTVGPRVGRGTQFVTYDDLEAFQGNARAAASAVKEWDGHAGVKARQRGVTRDAFMSERVRSARAQAPPDNVRPIRPAETAPKSPAEATTAQAAPDDGSPPSVAAGPSGAPPPAEPPIGGGGGSTTPTLPPAVRAAASEPTPTPPALPDVDAPDYNPAVRTRYTGSRDVRKAEANTVSNFIKEAVPDKVEREALSVRRAFKNDLSQLDQYADGTHPNLTKPGAREKIGALSDVLDKARNPTPAMLQADAVLDSYFTKTLGEGRELGFLDSSITPEEYINHLLQPGEEATASEGGYTYGQGGGVRRATPHAMKRSYGNVLDAIANGAAPRTLDAADAVSIYGDRHGHAAAARILENTLKDSELGKVLTSGNVPDGWVKLGGENSAWDREVPYHDRGGEESKLAVAHQSLYVPEKIAKALAPITDPNYLLKIPGYRSFQRFQDYIKSANVALAFFHLKAETINAFSNMKRGPVDMAKAFMTPLDDPGFLATERTAVQHGMQTSIVGQTAEAYRALEPKEMPTKIDVVRNLPVMRQIDAAAQATSKLTFDIAIRKYKVIDFASQDAAWMAQHPEATPVELARARRSIAREVNAVYGGLNWEALGITRTIHGLMRAFMFAPDWAYSNVETVNMAVSKGGPGGAAARWYMARSIAGGVAATAAMTYFMTGKKPGEVPGRMRDKLFNVYLGKDEKGNDKFMNVFFAGAPSDTINLAGNVTDYGIGKGVGATIANKMAAVPRAAMHVITNKDFMGRDIVPKDAGSVAGTAISIKTGVTDLAPLPFGATNAAQMALDPKREYTPLEYAAGIGLGVRPRHVKPPSQKPERARNSITDIIMGAPVHKGRTPYVSPFRRAMDSVADKLTAPKKGE